MEITQSIQTLTARYQQILDGERTITRKQLEDYRSRFPELIKRYQKARPKKQVVWTIPAIFRRSTDENFISDYLAYLLDPEKNGIGTAPLEAVLKSCQIEYDSDSLADALIHREYALEQGRIDLLIECGDGFILGIENKIYSPEGTGQTTYYSQVMADQFEDIPYHLIFLTRDGHKAGSSEFIPLSYSNLLSAFKEVSVEDLHEPRKLIMWQDFLEHLEVYIMASTPVIFEFSDKAKLYIENYEMLDDLTITFRRDWDQLLTFLDTQFLSYLPDSSWKTAFQPSYQQAYKPQWNKGGINIHYEWWLSPTSLLKEELAFGVDVEGARAAEAMELFEALYPQLEPQYSQKGITFRPRNRKIAIAYKKYKIGRGFDLIPGVFIESFDEFRFLEPIIDEIIEKLSKKE